MSNCGTCKYWGTKKDIGEAFRQCTAVIHDEHGRHRECIDDYQDDDDWDKKAREEIIAIRKQRACVVDGSGYFAALKCSEDFGCVLYAPSRANEGE